MRIPGLAGRVYQRSASTCGCCRAARSSRRSSAASSTRPSSSAPSRTVASASRKAAKFYYTTGWHETHRHRAARQQGRRGRAAGRPPGDRRERRRGLQRRQRGLVPEAPTPRRWRIWSRTRASSRSRCPTTWSNRCARRPTKILAEAAAKDPVAKKVHDTYIAFKAKHERGPALRGRLPQQDPRAEAPMRGSPARIDRVVASIGCAPRGSRSRSSLLMATNVLLRYLLARLGVGAGARVALFALSACSACPTRCTRASTCASISSMPASRRAPRRRRRRLGPAPLAISLLVIWLSTLCSSSPRASAK